MKIDFWARQLKKCLFNVFMYTYLWFFVIKSKMVFKRSYIGWSRKNTKTFFNYKQVIFYFSKSSLGPDLGGLAFRGGPDLVDFLLIVDHTYLFLMELFCTFLIVWLRWPPIWPWQPDSLSAHPTCLFCLEQKDLSIQQNERWQCVGCLKKK